jgi:hypothetical protein
MRYFTILAGVFAATAMTNPTSNANATAELMEHFRADDAMKAYTYNFSLDALNNIAACKSTINTSTANDKPKDLREVLLYVWCMECRDMYQKCMNISTPYPIKATVL